MAVMGTFRCVCLLPSVGLGLYLKGVLQVRVFSSREHVRALMAGDVWAVVGWSGDLLQLAERSGNVALSAPASGVPLWADLWAVPAGASGGSGARGPARSAAQGRCTFPTTTASSAVVWRGVWGGVGPLPRQPARLAMPCFGMRQVARHGLQMHATYSVACLHMAHTERH